MTQVPWFMYQNRLGPSDGIYYPNFAPCFVVLYLNSPHMIGVESISESPGVANFVDNRKPLT